jgi:hypothetical protein
MMKASSFFEINLPPIRETAEIHEVLALLSLQPLEWGLPSKCQILHSDDRKCLRSSRMTNHFGGVECCC